MCTLPHSSVSNDSKRLEKSHEIISIIVWKNQDINLFLTNWPPFPQLSLDNTVLPVAERAKRYWAANFKLHRPAVDQILRKARLLNSAKSKKHGVWQGVGRWGEFFGTCGDYSMGRPSRRCRPARQRILWNFATKVCQESARRELRGQRTVRPTLHRKKSLSTSMSFR